MKIGGGGNKISFITLVVIGGGEKRGEGSEKGRGDKFERELYVV